MENLQKINSKYALIAELKLYLESTDYHILKQAEGNYQVPEDVLEQRKLSRENINILQQEISELNVVENETIL